MAALTEIAHRTIEANGIRIHLAEAGEGPLVLLCHGFPESWHSWRWQLKMLSEAGFRAVAPDMRGYGGTDRPEEIEKRSMLRATATSSSNLPARKSSSPI
jgi:pimeloyl-ACP methyl ester carboxylesterase